MCGDLLNLPPDITFTRLRAVRRKGVNEHGPVQMSGVSGNFFGLMKRQRNGREKIIAKGPVPDSKTGCACLSPGEWTQTGDTGTGKGAGTRRNDEERGRETALPAECRQSFAGTVKAARPGRSQQALPLTLTSDIRH
uniref:Uncharacterized protein n=1 Tax=Klebsiella pneumoniae TaxID=573 RepID=A0A2P1BPF9_KLEPN|nr:hypothetical protein [Klebsiella pneumoniae]